jgi:hypothetical protein
MGKLTGTQHGDAANALFAFYADKAIRRTNWKKRANALWPRLPWLSGLSAPIDTPSHVRNDGEKPKHVVKDVVCFLSVNLPPINARVRAHARVSGGFPREGRKSRRRRRDKRADRPFAKIKNYSRKLSG